MNKKVQDVVSHMEEVRGLLDALQNEASEVYANASKAEPKMHEYKALCEKVAAKQMELASVEAELEAVRAAFKQFKSLVANG